MRDELRPTEEDNHCVNAKMVILTMLSASFILVGCQQDAKDSRSNQQRVAAYHSQLLQGRHNQHSNSAQSWGLMLQDGNKDPREASTEFDTDTGALTWITYNTDLMDDTARDNLASYCLAIIGNRTQDFMIESKELERNNREYTEFPNSQTIVSFYRTIDHIQVRDSYVDCVYTQSKNELFRLREIVNRTGGRISLSNADEPVTSFTELGEEIGTDGLELISNRELIKRQQNAKGIEYLKVNEFTVRDPSDSQTYTISIADGTKNIVEAFASKVSIDKYTFQASVYKSGYREGLFENLPLALATIAGGSDITVLDPDGSGNLATLPANVKITLSGPRGTIFDSPISETVPIAFNLAVSGEAIVLPNTLAQFPAINAFLNVQKVNRFVRRQLTPIQAPILQEAINVGINVTGSCNAFFDPTTFEISLFAAGVTGSITCPSMATINDVLYHEWGHGLDNSVGRTIGITDSAFSEGIGDIVASYLTKNPKIGQGFFLNTDTEIRSVDNTIRFPEGQGEVHDEGRIISGAFWDLRIGLIERYGAEAGSFHAERLFFNHLLNSDAYLESYENVLRLDDNDGNPITRSPNYCIINAAFAKHGLATAEAGCIDPQVGKNIAFNDQIKIAIVAATNKDAGKLMVSALPGTARVQLCYGSWVMCVPADWTDLELTPAGKSGGKLIFVTAAPYAIVEQQEITTIAKDAYGEIIGVQTMKFISK